MLMVHCLNCNKKTKNKKFCTRNCAAQFNNRGVRRHGNPPGICNRCGKPKKNYRRKFCSQECQIESLKKHMTIKEVDHILPLARGGLHHQDNLQYLTIEENRKKWCKVVGDSGTAPLSDSYEKSASL